MPKTKTIFTCSACGHETGRWLGKCPACHAYNTFEESVAIAKKTIGRGHAGGGRFAPTPSTGTSTRLSEIKSIADEKFPTGLTELDRVLSGGIVPGSLMLLGGEPGIGKSTILLQICQNKPFTILYVSGEESAGQINLRAARLGQFGENTYILAESDLAAIEGEIHRLSPHLLVIDSIQTMMHSDLTSAAGSVTQVREATAFFMRLAKERGMATIIVGHVTKEGAIAGPKILEHMVDCVLYFEGERHGGFRIIRAVKNRFGGTGEIGIFEMDEGGLKPITNPSEYMLTGRPLDAPGSIITCAMEGSRPILAEVQALVAPTKAPNPRRVVSGMDYNRINMLLAMLEKRCRLYLSQADSYVNVAGGMKLTEPAADLAAIAAIASSYKNKPINPETLIFGEVGLTGEVRAVNHTQKRIDEAAKLAFTEIIIPQANLKGIKRPGGVKILGVANIGELLALILA
ncbi:MAG: DNA repair protein RadA [Defluviitaleaceae bacterium]|nr:DNA repair protein RadA [Defluviitaleaceae bacterium]